MEQQFYESLISHQKPVGQRYQSVFELKDLGTQHAVQLLMQAYTLCGNSVLLKHELLYALGQLPKCHYPLIRQFLMGRVEDESENALSRHEAAEALANYFDQDTIGLYEKHLHSECKELKWTCEIAIEKVKEGHLMQKYGTKYCRTMEPAAPFSEHEFKSFLEQSGLQKQFQQSDFFAILCNEDCSLFQKYRILYYMRDLNTEECRKTLCELLSIQYFKTQTSLLKHEICFIIGQIGCESYEHLIRQCIQNQQQEEIVRHEALAAVASQSKDAEYLQKFSSHPSQLIRESALVAIHTIEYWNE